MRKNEEIIEDIKAVLRSFQEKYNEKKSDKIVGFIKEFFIDEKDTSFIGAGINSWYFGLEAIGATIKSYWEDESKYLDNIELDIEKSIISVENSVAIIAIGGKNIRNIKEEKTYEVIADKLSTTLKDKEISKSELIKLSTKIVRTLNNIKLGEEYIWPFRVTIVMINNGSKWMIKHMNLSFCEEDEDIVLNKENIDDRFKIIPIEKKASLEISEVQEVLKIFQEAYDKRDVNLVHSYGDELLHSDEDFSIFGTDQGEVFHGFDEGKELFESDWKHWGDFNLNRENAHICVLDNVAVVQSKALIKFNFEEKRVCSWPRLNLEWYLKNKKSNKELVDSMFLSINNALEILEVAKGETIAPMKFVGVLVKREGKWKFKHMHFSDGVDNMPERLEV